jgi:uracil-DNA glycosylase
MDFDSLLADIRACRHCADKLPLGPRPVVQASPKARIMIAGQAPGTKVHETGLPFNDPSGDRLRDWLGVSRDEFYDAGLFAIVPAGFCYPGRDARGGDKPPRPECAELWHPKLWPLLTRVELVLAIGLYSQRHHLGARRKANLTETVRAWRSFAPGVVPLPHPSWRNTGWIRRNPWFEAEVIPYLRQRVRTILAEQRA